MSLQVKRTSVQKVRLISTLMMVFAIAAQPLATTGIPTAFAAGEAVEISSTAELCDAIDHQDDGQTWTIESGTYGLGVCNSISAGGQTGWYFPIVANNLTINGVGNPTIYGTGFTANGNWNTQNLVSVFGDNVTIDGLTLMPKVEPNKTIEVLGSDFTLRNTVISPNTKTDNSEYNTLSSDDKEWGGSLYFSHAGNHTVQNVTINNAGVSFRYAPAGTHITFNDVKVVNTTNVDWINGYRFSSGFNAAENTTTGLPSVVYQVNSTLNNIDNVLSKVQNGDTIEIDSDLIVSHQLTLTKGVTVNGNDHTLSANFAKTTTSNNSVLGIQSNDVTVKSLIVDGVNGTNLHGINVYQSENVELENVTSKDNDYSGINVNGSKVTVTNVTTAHNGWHGIDVDKAGAVLTVNGVSHHDDALPIYIDNTTVGQVVDTNGQYTARNNVLQAGDRVYTIQLAAPTVVAPLTNSVTNDHSFDNVFTKVNGAAKYEYETTYNGGANYYADNSTSSNYDLSGSDVVRHNDHAPDATYKWHVRAVDAYGNAGKWSEYAYVTVDTVTPATPVLESPSSNALINYNNFWFEWNDVAGIDHYEFQASQNSATDSDNSLNSGVWHGDASGNEPTESRAWSAGANGTWYWQVRSVDAAGNKSAWAAPRKLTIDMQAPSTPQITAPTVNQEFTGTPGTIRAEWVAATDTSGIAKYQIEYVYTRNGQTVTDNRDVAGNRLYRDQSLSGTVLSDFTIRVRAQDKAGNWSDWSSPVTYYYGVSAPTTTDPVDNGDGSVPTNPGTVPQVAGSGASALTQSNGLVGGVTANAPIFVATDDNIIADTTAPTTDDDGQTLGTSDSKKETATSDDKGEVKGTSTGWNILGFAWYWWLLLLAALAAAWWWIAAARRRRNEDA